MPTTISSHGVGPSYDRALSEARRVLRPGGRLVLSTTHPTSDWMLLGGSCFDRGPVEETMVERYPEVRDRLEHSPGFIAFSLLKP